MESSSTNDHGVNIAQVECPCGMERTLLETQLLHVYFKLFILASFYLPRLKNTEQTHLLLLIFPRPRRLQQTWGHLNRVHILQKRRVIHYNPYFNTHYTSHVIYNMHPSCVPWNLFSRRDTSSEASFTAWMGSVMICWMSENNNRCVDNSEVCISAFLFYLFLVDVTHLGLPCTPQSQTSPLLQPPRTGEQPGQSAAPQTFSASPGAPDPWIWEILSAVLLRHWTRWLPSRRPVWLLHAKHKLKEINARFISW